MPSAAGGVAGLLKHAVLRRPEDRAADGHRGPGDRLAGVLVHDRALVMQRLPVILLGLGGVFHGLGPLRGVIGGRWRGAEPEPRGEARSRRPRPWRRPGSRAARQRCSSGSWSWTSMATLRYRFERRSPTPSAGKTGRTCGPAPGGRGTSHSPPPSSAPRPGRRPGSPGRAAVAAAATRTRADRRARSRRARRGSSPGVAPLDVRPLVRRKNRRAQVSLPSQRPGQHDHRRSQV